MTEPILTDVSDTALWVAVYRARETARPDALFRDPLASRLSGERGTHIEKQMSNSNYVEWAVVIRTCIIDAYIEKLIAEGVDTVVNLGAGLDTRPYRLSLPADLRWIEIDFPRIIALKEERLKSERPKCRLERIVLDLSKEEERRATLAKINSEARKVLVLTEGVTPYLSNSDVASLARALREQTNFKYWITDYVSPELTKYMMRPSRKKEMQNAPFLFQPSDWLAFFNECGWRQREIRYIGEEARKLHRAPPHKFWMKLIQRLLMPASAKTKFNRYNGYSLLEPT